MITSPVLRCHSSLHLSYQRMTNGTLPYKVMGLILDIHPIIVSMITLWLSEDSNIPQHQYVEDSEHQLECNH